MPVTAVRLLGPIELTLDGRPVTLGANKQRAVLAMLALRANSIVSVDELIDGLWGERAPASAVKLVQHYVSQLRKLLAGGDAAIVTRGRGYELRVHRDGIDVARFERLAEAAARGNGDPTAAREALALWRGSPLAELIDEPFAAAELRRLEELRLAVTERSIAADLEAGRCDEVVARLDDLIAHHPLHERLHALRMRALYGSGRQADALAAFRQARATLIDEVGVEPGPELQRLHAAMLRQDPDLAPAGRRAARPPPRRLPRRLLVAAAAAAIAGGTALAVVRGAGSDRLAGIDENAVGRIDATGERIVAQYGVGREPRSLAAGARSVWVADAKDETVSRIDPSRDRIVTIPVGSDPVAVAFGAGALWVAERGDGAVAQISPVSNKVVGRIEPVNAPSTLAVGFGSVWVGSEADETVSRIGVGSFEIGRRTNLGAPPSAIAVGAGAVWVTSEESGTLFRLDPRTGAVRRAVRVGNRPVSVAAGPSGVWVVNRQDATVWRIDPATDRVTDTIHVGRDPSAVVAGDSDVWVAGAGDAKVTRVDARTRRIAGAVDVGNSPTALALQGTSVWAAALPTPARHRGGTLTVTMQPFDFPTLEAGTYEPQAQQVLSLAYDGLLTYRRTGGTTFGPLAGGLARDVPEASDSGRTYVFTLRPGIRFSNGAPVKAEDFRASLADLLRRHGKTLPPFFDAIVGARRCITRPRACDLSRGVVTDAGERTITLHLSRPDHELLHALASPLAYVAPAEHRFGGGRRPPGTGPYRVVRFDAARGADLSRNPYFKVPSSDARPDGLPDRIRIRTAADLGRSVAAVERGEVDVVPVADVFGPLLAPRAIRALTARHLDRIHTSVSPTLDFMWLNVRVPPFDDVRARRALNYAIDRAAIVERAGGETLARGTCQFVPLGHPGFFPACRYTRDPRPAGGWSGPDLDRARALIARSGTAGTRVTVWAPSDKRLIGRYFVRLLATLGYRSRLRVPGDYGEYHEFVANSAHEAQIGVDAWAADLPTPSNFAAPFTCDAYLPRSPENINLAEFCDRDFERRIEAALAAPGSAAAARWRAVYDDLARAAPAVPLVNRRSAVLVSRRVGNFQHHPLFGVLLDQLWVR